jgi:quinol monooxygenase YgiN
MLVSPADRPSIEAALPEHISQTRNETGCLHFDVAQDATNPLRFNVYEVFSSKRALSEHQARTRASHWGAVSRNVERHYTVRED